MGKLEEYKNILLSLPDQEQFLKSNSNLPGPRANLELLYAFIEVSSLELVEQLLKKDSPQLSINNPEEFISCCAVSACGKHILEEKNHLTPILKSFASDGRWRIRESVAMALQHIGKYNFRKLYETTTGWEVGTFYEQRAIAAGLCEPAILKSLPIKEYTLKVLTSITTNLPASISKTTPSYKSLVQAMGYCWSVAVVAYPEKGKSLFEALVNHPDKDIRRLIKENLKKNRLVKMDKDWVFRLTSLNN